MLLEMTFCSNSLDDLASVPRVHRKVFMKNKETLPGILARLLSDIDFRFLQETVVGVIFVERSETHTLQLTSGQLTTIGQAQHISLGNDYKQIYIDKVGHC